MNPLGAQATKNQLGTTISSQLDTIHVGIDKIDASSRAVGTVQSAFKVLSCIPPQYLDLLDRQPTVTHTHTAVACHTCTETVLHSVSMACYIVA